jgi:phosphate uptake regulator
MKRKVIKHGPATLIVSLPAKWVKEKGIVQGNLLDVNIINGRLDISTDAPKDIGNIDIDISAFDKTTIIFYIRNLYRQGYKIINVKCSNPSAVHLRNGKDSSVSSIIYEEVDRLIGMEIIEQGRNSWKLEEITESSGGNFEALKRKIFFQLSSAMEELANGIKKGDSIGLGHIENIHYNVAKFVSYCIRLMNQGRVHSSPQEYHLLVGVDLIMDIITYFKRDVEKSINVFSKENISIIEDLAKINSLYIKFHLTHNREGLMEMLRLRDQVKRKMAQGLGKGSKGIMLLNYLVSILEIYRNMVETELAIMDSQNSFSVSQTLPLRM